MDAQHPLVPPTHQVWASPALARAVRDDQPGAVIRLARRAAGLTLEQLGNLYGCSASTLSRVEREHPPIDQVEVRRDLALLLGIPTEYVGLARHASPAEALTTQAATLGQAPGSGVAADLSSCAGQRLWAGSSSR
ncbi:helix-turn-helix domain-containing protein, partial [Actinoplanes couchii]